MARPETKTQAIREILNGSKPLLADELRDKLEIRLQQVIGRQQLYDLLSVAKGIKTTGRADQRRYQLVKT